MVILKTILILEDNLRVLSMLFSKLYEIEGKVPYSLSTIVLTTEKQTRTLTRSVMESICVVLLDKDCKAGGSFHCLDIESIGLNKVIGISGVEANNQELVNRGVTNTVLKDMNQLDVFIDLVGEKIQQILFAETTNLYREDKIHTMIHKPSRR